MIESRLLCIANVLLCTVALTFACPAGPVAAQTSTQSTVTADDPDPWRFNTAAYGWAMGVTGNITARGKAVDVTASFVDLLQRSQSVGGLMAYFEADKGKVGVYADFVYTSLGFGANTTSYRNPIAGLRISAAAGAALTYDLFIIEVGGVHEFARWQHSEHSSTTVDGVLAFRYWNNSIRANFDVATNVNLSSVGLERSFGIAVARADAIQWVDPVVGLRARHRFSPRQELTVRGDIGGFGLGSQFSWQAVGVYSYAWDLDGGQKLAALLGFRALGVNYSSGSGADALSINQTLYGPVFGISYRF